MSTRTRFTVVAAAAFVALGLAGCATHTSPSATPKTTTQEPAPAASTPATTTPASPSPSTSAPATTGTGTGTVGACTTANLTASIAQGSGGAAGSVYVTLVLTNKGAASCTLQGWPGTSLVGGGTGVQIGAAAKFDTSSAHGVVTLASGSSAKSTLQYVQAANYDASKCQPEKGDGFRVYPPGQKASLFAKYPYVTGCKSTSVSLFTVGALQ